MWHPIEKRCITSRDVTFKKDVMFMFDKSNETFDSNYKPNKIEVEHPPNHESNKLPSTTKEELELSSFILSTQKKLLKKKKIYHIFLWLEIDKGELLFLFLDTVRRIL